MKNMYEIKGDKVIIWCVYKGDRYKVWIDKKDLTKVKVGTGWRITNLGYCITYLDGKATFLHRHLMGNVPKGKQVDHINRDKLDNTRNNLRIVSPSVNSQNRGYESNNSSGYRGVHWVKASQKWKAVVTYEDKQHLVGFYEKGDLQNAVIDVIIARKKIFGGYSHRIAFGKHEYKTLFGKKINRIPISLL